MDREEIVGLYEEIGAVFVKEIDQIQSDLAQIKCFIFHWDGVFHQGTKYDGFKGSFSEPDSMGINLLRYSKYLISSEMPKMAIITGLKNSTAKHFSEREKFDFQYQNFKEKSGALEHLLHYNNLKPSECAYFFDDLLDINVAEQVALRILVSHNANPYFSKWCEKNQFADYITAHSGGFLALREACEMLMATQGNIDQVFMHRKNFDFSYKAYLQKKRDVQLLVLEPKDIGLPEFL